MLLGITFLLSLIDNILSDPPVLYSFTSPERAFLEPKMTAVKLRDDKVVPKVRLLGYFRVLQSPKCLRRSGRRPTTYKPSGFLPPAI